jgi:predicted Zn finger-like uncharacterized protein
MLLNQCPECETAFRLTLDDLAKAGGQVQCGHCRNIFNAIEHGTQEHEQGNGKLPGEEPAVLTTDPAAVAGLTDAGVEAPRQVNVESVPGKISAVEIARRLAALFNLQRARLLTGLLAMLFVVQLAMIFSETLLSNSLIRSWLGGVCQVFPCEIPAFVDLDALIIKQSAMISLDSAQQRLLTARLYNGGGIEQRLPSLQLELIDDRGVQVARRVFLPGEYLKAKSERIVIGAGDSLQVSLPIVLEELQPLVTGYRLQLMP